MSFLQNSLQQDKGIPGAVKEVGLLAETTVPSAQDRGRGGAADPRSVLVRHTAPAVRSLRWDTDDTTNKHRHERPTELLV